VGMQEGASPSRLYHGLVVLTVTDTSSRVT
jgi:hypothetical protein